MSEGIVIQDLTFSYKRQESPIISLLSVKVPAGGFSALLGSSGSGKTTLLEIIAGIYRPDTAHVLFNGQVEIEGKKPGQERSPEVLSLMFQNSSLLEHLTVLDNVLLPRKLKSGRVEKHDVRRAEFLLDGLRIGQYRRKKPLELSGGTAKRVALARALVCRPKVLLLDEPFAGVDVITKAGIYQLLHEERCGQDLTTLFATHDLTDAALLASTIFFFGTRSKQTVCDVFQCTPAIVQDQDLEVAICRATEMEPKLAIALQKVSPVHASTG